MTCGEWRIENDCERHAVVSEKFGLAGGLEILVELRRGSTTPVRLKLVRPAKVLITTVARAVEGSEIRAKRFRVE